MKLININQMYRPTVVEIDLDAISENVRAIREAVGPDVKIMPAVKADGYGHGSVPVSRAAISGGADVLGVASLEEAMTLRDSGITAPILILGCSTYDSTPDIVEYGISATVCDMGFAQALSDEATRRGKKALAHVKVDTGMGRIGVPPSEAARLVTSMIELPSVELEGIFTHFPSSDEPDRSFTEWQINTFKSLLSELDVRGITPTITHAANSAAVLDYPDASLDMVRPGLIVYGLYPTPNASRSIKLRPALTFKTRIMFIKESPAGTTVSYGRTYTTRRTTKVATIAVGYADGYDRDLSNRGEVAVREHRAPVIGRVCMDQTMIDVTDVPGVEVGDEVILLGGGFDFLSVERVAAMINTIPHDVICAIGKRVPRVHIGGEKKF